MAIAPLTLEDLRAAGLADVDPEIADLLAARARAPARRDRADRLRELHLAVDARSRRQRADEQVLGGLSGPPLLRRLRGRRRDRAARDRPREGALRRRARERPAACRRADEHGRVLRVPGAGRHDPLARARARRPSHARAQGQLLRPALRDRPLRRLARDEPRRLRRRTRAREGAPAEAHRLRRLGVSAHGRGLAVPRDRGRGRRAPPLRHGPLRRVSSRRGSIRARAALRLRHLDDAQDARRAALRLRPLQGGARAGGRPGGVPRDAGRAAQPRDRREGGLLPDRGLGAVPALPGERARERRCARRGAPGRWARRADRRHRHAPPARRPAVDRVDGQGRRGAARARSASRSTATPFPSTSARRQ